MPWRRTLLAAMPVGCCAGAPGAGTSSSIWLIPSVRLAGVGLLAYGVLQVIEGVGLWGGWRWAEYLAVVATSAFIPLEIYELVNEPTALKLSALVVNVVVVIYLVWKGRLFGVRGGHEAFLAELRDSTLPADVLRSLGRTGGADLRPGGVTGSRCRADHRPPGAAPVRRAR